LKVLIVNLNEGEDMSFRIQSGRQYPDNINMSNVKSVSPEFLETLEALMISKLSKEGSASEVTSLYAAMSSNASVQVELEELKQQLKALKKARK